MNNIPKIVGAVLWAVVVLYCSFRIYKSGFEFSTIETMLSILLGVFGILPYVRPHKSTLPITNKSTPEEIYDKNIIEELLKKIPFDNIKVSLEQSHITGVPLAFILDLDNIKLDFDSPKSKLYNHKLEERKKALISSIDNWLETAYDFLGPNEDPTLTRSQPPYHWKNHSATSEQKYYKLQEELEIKSTQLINEYETFLSTVHDSKVLFAKELS
ncbi:hypothetical protein LGZ99_10195 [Photorhabdus temperata]|nr:hypothetical protein [Photorhabdus temperata]MCT8347573.1 hypothetical protein [Photorhabdus temperata]